MIIITSINLFSWCNSILLLEDSFPHLKSRIYYFQTGQNWNLTSESPGPQSFVGLATLVTFPLQRYTMVMMAAQSGTWTAERPISPHPIQWAQSGYGI